MMDFAGTQGEGIGAERMDSNGGEVSEESVTDGKEPGWAWKNKVAVEEYRRAMEHVVDQTFSLRMTRLNIEFLVLTNMLILDLGEFGDPFDERDINGSL
jgi:hypothetical protein